MSNYIEELKKIKEMYNLIINSKKNIIEELNDNNSNIIELFNILNESMDMIYEISKNYVSNIKK